VVAEGLTRRVDYQAVVLGGELGGNLPRRRHHGDLVIPEAALSRPRRPGVGRVTAPWDAATAECDGGTADVCSSEHRRERHRQALPSAFLTLVITDQPLPIGPRSNMQSARDTASLLYNRAGAWMRKWRAWSSVLLARQVPEAKCS
jgi:hypothetical protein